ncbi:hypothetical protein GA0115235_101729, partial [Streptomyces sp. DpondAA-F4a]
MRRGAFAVGTPEAGSPDPRVGTAAVVPPGPQVV